MKFNRRTTAVLIAALFASSLTSCDNSQELSRTFTNANDEEGVTFTYFYKGDAILRQDTESKIVYKSMGAENAEQARQAIEPMIAHYAGIKGAKYSADYQQTAVLVRVSVDFSQVNDSDLCRLQGKDPNCEKPSLSLAESAEHRLAQGFVEVK